MAMATIRPFIWFEDRAEEAINFYTSIFKDSRKDAIQRMSDVVPGPKGQVYTGTFALCGQEFMVLNGGPIGEQSKLTGAISFFLEVENQEEVDYFWQALIADGGQSGPCGWLTDKFGVTW